MRARPRGLNSVLCRGLGRFPVAAVTLLIVTLLIWSAGIVSSKAGEPTPAGELPADAWSDFRNGPQLRGIAHTELPARLELLWAVETHDGVTSTAAIANGRVYVGGLSGHIQCLDLAGGDEVWRYRTIESTDPEEFAPGFNAPLTLSATTVFAGDEDGTFHALDRTTGEVLWKFSAEDQIVGGASLLPGGRVMFGSHDGKLYCLNARTGEKAWEFEALGPVNGSQAIGEGVTFVSGCSEPILRVVDFETGEQRSEVPLQGLLIASPALDGDVLYFGSPDGEIIALDWRESRQLWAYSDPVRAQEIHSSPALTDELVLIGSRDKRLHAVDRATGKERWNFETRGPIDSSPVVVGDRVYFASADRTLYAVSLKGQEVWQHNAGQRFSASPAIGEGHLVIGAEGPGGKILCFGARP